MERRSGDANKKGGELCPHPQPYVAESGLLLLLLRRLLLRCHLIHPPSRIRETSDLDCGIKARWRHDLGAVRKIGLRAVPMRP